MKILFDINHPVDVNFFKPAIQRLESSGHEIHIIFRPRGKVERILRHELSGFPITPFGKHKKGFINKIMAQLRRDIELIGYLRKEKFDVVACFGPTSAIAARICKIPYLAFEDDFEYKIPFYHANLFSTRHIYPDYIEYSNRKTHKYHGFKELAYLNESDFKPGQKVLEEYGLKKHGYVFIREIATVSLNYKSKTLALDKIIDKILEHNLKPVLSLEDDDLRERYSKMATILREPVSDIYSVLFYACMAISSGDTMAREASLLRVRTIYTGGREMAMNKPLVDLGMMIEQNEIDDILQSMDDIFREKRNQNCKETGSQNETNIWDDTSDIIVQHILDFQKN